MNFSSFHKDFKLNRKSFTTIDEILSYTKHHYKDVHYFLESWFSKTKSITVKTSGSTGTPKAILLKKEYILNSALETGKYFNAFNKTKALLCLSPTYIAGKMMLVRALTLGWHLDIVAPKSNPLENLKNTYDFCAMVPLQLQNSIPFLSQIKQLIVGGGPVSNVLIQKIQDVTCIIYATYGMTETITHIAVKKLNNYDFHPQYFTVLNNVNIYVDTRSCLVIDASNVSDEIVVTNDVVSLISDKKFKWLGRFDNIINSGGVKLYPEKIELKLAKQIPERFFVAGLLDDVLGERLIVVVEGKERAIDLNNSDLSKFEKPKDIFFVDKFVETTTEKIQRKKTLELIFD